MLRAGCAGFPVARERYFAELPVVEVFETFQKLPRLATAEKWRAGAPKDFAYSMRAWQAVTHTSASASFEALSGDVSPKRRHAYGHFRDSPEVGLAWDATRAFATALGARFVVFETPGSFYPDADHLRDMYRFFNTIRRDRLTLVWQPKGAWGEALARKVAKELRLLLAVDPLSLPARPARADVNYFRVAKLPPSDKALSALRALCDDAPSYVIFTARDGWDQARRLTRLAGR